MTRQLVRIMVAALGVALALTACSKSEPSPASRFVVMMHSGVFGKEPDRATLKHWVSQIEASVDKKSAAKDMAEAFLLSEKGLAQNATSQDRVVALYRAFLNRSPGDGEIEYWAAQQDEGRETLESLVNKFADSEECSRVLAEYFGGPIALALPVADSEQKAEQ